MAFSRATLALTQFLRNYAGSPWTGDASGGASSGRTMGGINVPTVGASLNGHASAAFTSAGTTSLDSGSGSGQTLSAYLGAGAGSGWFLVQASALAADPGAGSRFGGPALFDDNGGTFAQLNVDAAGANLGLIDGVGYAETGKAAPLLIVGKPALVQFRYDGANMTCRVNANAWTANVVNGGITAGGLGNFVRLGRGGAFLNALMWEAAFIDSALTLAQLDAVGADIQDYYGVQLGFTPPIVSYPHRIDRRQHERFRQHAARMQFYAAPISPPSTLAQLQPFPPRHPDRIPRPAFRPEQQDTFTSNTLPIPTDTTTFAQMRAGYPDRVTRPAYRATNQDAFEMNSLPIPTDTTTFAQSRNAWPDRVTRPIYHAKHQDAFEMNPFPVAAPFSPINPLSTFADTIARRRPTQPQADVLPPQQIANPFSPINPLVEFPDTVPRPRFGAYLQMHVTSLSPRPERTSPIVSVVHPDRVVRPRMAPAMMRFTALDPKPEQKVALGFQGRFPSEVRRPRYHARHQQPFTFWPLPIPTPPVVAVPIVTQDGTVVLLSAHGSKVVKLDAQSAVVSLLTARGVRVVTLDQQSGEVRLLSARYGETE